MPTASPVYHVEAPGIRWAPRRRVSPSPWAASRARAASASMPRATEEPGTSSSLGHFSTGDPSTLSFIAELSLKIVENGTVTIPALQRRDEVEAPVETLTASTVEIGRLLRSLREHGRGVVPRA